MICEVCRGEHGEVEHPHRVACKHVNDLRIASDDWRRRIADAPLRHSDSKSAMEAAFAARRDASWLAMREDARGKVIERALAAEDTKFAAAIEDMKRRQGETAAALAVAEQAILDLRAAPGRERRAAARGEIAALLDKHAAATAAVETSARALVTAIDDVHSIERHWRNSTRTMP